MPVELISITTFLSSVSIYPAISVFVLAALIVGAIYYRVNRVQKDNVGEAIDRLKESDIPEDVINKFNLENTAGIDRALFNRVCKEGDKDSLNALLELRDVKTVLNHWGEFGLRHALEGENLQTLRVFLQQNAMLRSLVVEEKRTSHYCCRLASLNNKGQNGYST